MQEALTASKKISLPDDDADAVQLICKLLHFRANRTTPSSTESISEPQNEFTVLRSSLQNMTILRR